MNYFKPLLFLAVSLSVNLSAIDNKLPPEEIQEIATKTYIYGYPLVLMGVTRAVGTNPRGIDELRGPVNQLLQARNFPDASFTDIVRPNADTLYTLMHYDVTNAPLVVTIPDSQGRYYLMAWMDMWTDIFTVPGTRTTGNGAQKFAIVGPNWKGEMPEGVTVYKSPTAQGMLIGRTQTNGKKDYQAVHAFQNGMKAEVLTSKDTPSQPQAQKFNPNISMKSPPDQLDAMDGKAFFTRLAELMKNNPPHANDYPIIDRMKRIGIEPGKDLNYDALPDAIKKALDKAPTAALKLIKDQYKRAGVLANGWRMDLTAIGTYGTDYLSRAGVAYAGIGANVPQDAVYPTLYQDEKGYPLYSNNSYVLHFDKDSIPPVNAFWSVTMYNDQQLFAENTINRYSLNGEDPLNYNADGSLEIYIQPQSPGKELEANWLPTPKTGTFTMNLRLYWPKENVLDGSWSPPRITTTGEYSPLW